MTDDACPFHDLPPEQTVRIQLDDGVKHSYSAGFACEQFHFAVVARAAIDAGLRTAMKEQTR